jgi:hypothetical protein
MTCWSMNRQFVSHQHWRLQLEVSVCLTFIPWITHCYASGFVTHYASWRTMQGLLGLTGLATFISVFMFLPETTHPGTRGIDNLHLELSSRGKKPRSVVFINPCKPLSLLRSPNLLAVVSRCRWWFFFIKLLIVRIW